MHASSLSTATNGDSSFAAVSSPFLSPQDSLGFCNKELGNANALQAKTTKLGLLLVAMQVNAQHGELGHLGKKALERSYRIWAYVSGFGEN